MGGLATMTRAAAVAVGKTGMAGVPAQGFLPALGAMPSASGMNISQASAMGVSTVWSCVTRRASDVARCAPQLLPMSADGAVWGQRAARGEKPIVDHPVARLFARPNWVQTWYEFCLQMETAFLLKRNAYAAILRDGRGKPEALIPINPDAVLILEAPDGQIFYQVNRIGLFQLSVLRDMPMAIPSEDIFHLRGISFNVLVGLSAIGSARDAIGLAMGQEQQASRWMANGARPSGVLQTDRKLSGEAAGRLREQWDAFRAGIQNVGRTAILEEGLKWSPMQLTSVDMEFIQQRNLSVAEIARFFGVPLYKIDAAEPPRGMPISQLDQSYVNDTILPDLEMWEQKFNQVFGLDLEKTPLTADFDERRLLRADEATRINNQRLKIMSGISTQNECRRENGDPPMDGGDVLLRPVNLAASGSDMTGTAPDGAGRPAAGHLPDPGAPNEPAPAGGGKRSADEDD